MHEEEKGRDTLERRGKFGGRKGMHVQGTRIKGRGCLGERKIRAIISPGEEGIRGKKKGRIGSFPRFDQGGGREREIIGRTS